MPRLLVAAFHESTSIEKLGELFSSDSAQLFAGTPATHCPKCKRQFAVFFPSSDDPQNFGHLKTIEEMISNDCRDGKHLNEIKLNFG